MYIDFKDPEKTAYNKKPQSKPIKKRRVGLFSRKSSKQIESQSIKKSAKNSLQETAANEHNLPSVEQVTTKKPNQNSDKNVNILEQINRVVKEQNNNNLESSMKKGGIVNTEASEIKLAEEIGSVSGVQENSSDLTQEKNSIAKDKRLIAGTSSDNNYIPLPVPKVGKANFEPFKFKGKSKEYFKIWIVNVALSILTLGIYSAWAKVRTNRYIYGNTYLNNSNFEFNADPKRILIGRMIIVLFYGGFLLFGNYLNMYKVAAGIVLVFLLLLPWLIRQAISFRLKSASYRNIPFKFHAKARSFYLLSVVGIIAIIVMPSLIILASKFTPELAGILGFVAYVLLFAVIIPILYRRYKALVVNNSTYANAKFYFSATKKDAIKMFVKMGFLTFALSLIFGLITLAVTGMGSTLLSYIPTSITQHPMFKYIVTFFGMVLYLFFTGLYKGVTDGYLSNFVRDHTRLEGAKFKGEIDPSTLGVISATNGLMLIFSIGLLYPYTKLRYLKYKIENTYFACNDYDKFISQGYDKTNPIGEEAMDFFDIDIGV